MSAACMPVRGELFESLNSLDETFAIALNGVDFCLHAVQAGAQIVYASGIDVYHFESLSLGRHYPAARAGLQALEVRRVRNRWKKSIDADHFYDPCASLEPGRVFMPGFPLRLTPLLWCRQEAPEPHCDVSQSQVLHLVGKSGIAVLKGHIFQSRKLRSIGSVCCLTGTRSTRARRLVKPIAT